MVEAARHAPTGGGPLRACYERIAKRRGKRLALKAHDGDTLVDLIFEPMAGPVTDEVLERGSGSR
jgi:hypothetical protein